MKEQILKNYLIICSVILVISSCFALTSINTDSPTNSTTSKGIFESDEIIKTVTNIEQNLINIEEPFRDIYSIFRTKCSEESIQEANNKIESMKILWNSDSKVENRIIDLNNKFSWIQKMLSAVDTDDKDEFCTQKYLLYNMLEETQNQYVQLTNNKLIKYTKLQDSSNTVQKPKVKVHSAPSSIKYINLVNRTNDLNDEELNYANLADEYIQKEIWKLLEKNFLTQEDLKILDNKIVLNYNKTCANTKWAFHMLQSSDWKQKIFKSIILNVNLCDNKSFIQNYTNYIRQIFIHEISHYIYMFRDTWTADFDIICWDSGKGCSEDSFVSNYANSNAAEDYAESFAYWYLDNFNWVDKQHWSSSNSILWEKLSYFNKLAQRLQE